MPSGCCYVIGCKAEFYSTGHIFQLPSKASEDIKQSWLTNIPQRPGRLWNFEKDGLCNLHFKDDCIIKTSWLHGEVMESVDPTHWQLTDDAVPTVFPNRNPPKLLSLAIPYLKLPKKDPPKEKEKKEDAIPILANVSSSGSLDNSLNPYNYSECDMPELSPQSATSSTAVEVNSEPEHKDFEEDDDADKLLENGTSKLNDAVKRKNGSAVAKKSTGGCRKRKAEDSSSQIDGEKSTRNRPRGRKAKKTTPLSRKCIIPSCNSRGNMPGITFHSVPSNEQIRDIWIQRLDELFTQNRMILPVLSDFGAWVCSRHFQDSDFQTASSSTGVGIKIGKRLNDDAVPSVFNNSPIASPSPPEKLYPSILKSSGQSSRKSVRTTPTVTGVTFEQDNASESIHSLPSSSIGVQLTPKRPRKSPLLPPIGLNECFVKKCDEPGDEIKFQCPKDPEVVTQWIRNLPKREFPFDPTLHSVCVRHFDPSFITECDSFVINNDCLDQPRDRKTITEDAVPTIFKGYSAYYQKKLPKKRSTPEVRAQKAKEEAKELIAIKQEQKPVKNSTPKSKSRRKTKTSSRKRGRGRPKKNQPPVEIINGFEIEYGNDDDYLEPEWDQSTGSNVVNLDYVTSNYMGANLTPTAKPYSPSTSRRRGKHSTNSDPLQVWDVEDNVQIPVVVAPEPLLELGDDGFDLDYLFKMKDKFQLPKDNLWLFKLFHDKDAEKKIICVAESLVRNGKLMFRRVVKIYGDLTFRIESNGIDLTQMFTEAGDKINTISRLQEMIADLASFTPCVGWAEFSHIENVGCGKKIDGIWFSLECEGLCLNITRCAACVKFKQSLILRKHRLNIGYERLLREGSVSMSMDQIETLPKDDPIRLNVQIHDLKLKNDRSKREVTRLEKREQALLEQIRILKGEDVSVQSTTRTVAVKRTTAKPKPKVEKDRSPPSKVTATIPSNPVPIVKSGYPTLVLVTPETFSAPSSSASTSVTNKSPTEAESIPEIIDLE